MTATNDTPVTAEVPLFATQGGGLATFENGIHVWYSGIPDFLQEDGVRVGDRIPEEWGVEPANDAAILEFNDALMDGFDCGEPWL